MLTAFDVGVGVLLLISAILATARGFTREILSLATWLGAAAIAAYLYFYQRTLLDQFFADPLISTVVLVAGGFLVSLIVLHLITMRIADFVVDSRIGPLDRTLGFIFGILRGGLITVVAVIFLGWLMPSPPSWVSESKSLPFLEKLGDDLVAALPPDLEKLLTDFIQRDGAEDIEPGTGPAEEGTDQLENDSPLEAPAEGGSGA